MSRIDELIAELCPQGVEYKRLGDVAKIIGTNIQPASMAGEQVSIYSLPSYDRGRVPERLSPRDVGSAKTAVGVPVVLVPKLNPHIPRIWKLERVDRNSYCSPEFYPVAPMAEVLNLSYLYYVICTNIAWLSGTVTGSTNSHKRLQREDYLKLPIPIPPLEVQREIVRILDHFTQLEAELEAELEARRRQYEHYRDSFLTFDAGRAVRWVSLREVCEFRRGTAITAKQATPGAIPVVANGPGSTYSHTVSNRDGQTIVVARSGAYAGLVSFWEGPIFLTDAFSLQPNPEVLTPKYVFHLLQGRQAQLHDLKKGAGVPHVRVKDVEAYEVPVPPLEEQERIVTILDKFDTLVNDSSIGLPAELAARRKQYEHYRHRLLTFKESAA